MDLITGLPQIGKHNTILMIVNHGCSHTAIFLLVLDTITGTGIAQLYMDYIYHWFGLPAKVISDWDPYFTSHFGQELTKMLDIRQNLSTVFHPQTDGLSEQKNQWIEQYLHTVTGGQPMDWNKWLSITTAVHNNHTNSTIRMSPNQVLIGCKTRLLPDLIIQSQNLAVEEQVTTIREQREWAIQALNQAVNALPPPQSWYKLGEQVRLKAQNLKTQYQSSKLAPKHHGPFQIIKEVSPVAYQ